MSDCEWIEEECEFKPFTAERCTHCNARRMRSGENRVVNFDAGEYENACSEPQEGFESKPPVKSLPDAFARIDNPVGRFVVGRCFPGEGYAVMKCGDLEIQIGCTLLKDMHFETPEDTSLQNEYDEMNIVFELLARKIYAGGTGD